MAKFSDYNGNFSEEKAKKAKKEFNSYKNRAEDLLDDVEVTEQTVDEAEAKAKNSKEAFKDIWEQLQLMFSIIKDYAAGRYKKIPKKSIISILGGLIYLLTPIDVIPDFIPIAGYVDDLFVLKLVYETIKKDLEQYKIWKES